jgi:2,4-dienoyl-CoA reductase-like NADH-dependent reductase (Old Yellow Enzyme family)
MKSPVFETLTLPNGQVLKNRLVKASMEEGMANAQLLPDESLWNLYRKWSEGGVGLILTGNVMIDRLAMTGPGGVALVDESGLPAFSRLAKEAKSGGAKVWMQINHPGRQVYAALGGKALSASDVALNMGKHSHMFAKPRPMNEAEIQDVIERFVRTAQLAEKAGFDGVEIHAAHGYLLSQFLSPLTNKRVDQWGGNIENRARLLIEVTKRIKAAVAATFAVGVKINSADFQRGGFDIEDAKSVVEMLNPLGVDAIEISGGSYEAPAMQGRTADQRTLAREAYFLEFAEQIAKVSKVPLMSTGGVTRLATAEQVVNAGVQLVGMASALAIQPNLPNLWQQGHNVVPELPRPQWSDKTIAALAVMSTIKRYLRGWGAGGKPQSLSPIVSLILDRIKTVRLTKRYKNAYTAQGVKEGNQV